MNHTPIAALAIAEPEAMLINATPANRIFFMGPSLSVKLISKTYPLSNGKWCPLGHSRRNSEIKLV